MTYVELPDNGPRRLSFYLAMEEFVAREKAAGDYFFMWQTPPSVIFGRNQLIESEVNIPFCRNNGIAMYRRKSGGGCVYSDGGNVMMSYITKDDHVGLTFSRYINMIALVLSRIGIAAAVTGRNDILIGGRKVSGTAFYRLPGRDIVHGTLLYDTDMRLMTGSITPADSKLQSKGVKSVRQHITLLKDHTEKSLGEIIVAFRQTLCSTTMTLDDDDIREIEKIEEEYLDDSFIFGNNPKYTVVKKKRIENVGDLELRMEIKTEAGGGKVRKVIKSVNLLGDFFLTGDLDALLGRLINRAADRAELEAALGDAAEQTILNLKKQELINLILL